jgi:hypothetical protein
MWRIPSNHSIPKVISEVWEDYMGVHCKPGASSSNQFKVTSAVPSELSQYWSTASGAPELKGAYGTENPRTPATNRRQPARTSRMTHEPIYREESNICAWMSVFLLLQDERQPQPRFQTHPAQPLPAFTSLPYHSQVKLSRSPILAPSSAVNSRTLSSAAPIDYRWEDIKSRRTRGDIGVIREVLAPSFKNPDCESRKRLTQFNWFLSHPLIEFDLLIVVMPNQCDLPISSPRWDIGFLEQDSKEFTSPTIQWYQTVLRDQGVYTTI